MGDRLARMGVAHHFRASARRTKFFIYRPLNLAMAISNNPGQLDLTGATRLYRAATEGSEVKRQVGLFAWETKPKIKANRGERHWSLHG